jgi:hypothetical protein
MIDTSTFVGLHGEIVEQHMGSSSGYAEYLAAFEAAEDKAEFNSRWFFGGRHDTTNEKAA